MESSEVRILLVDDDLNDVALIRTILNGIGGSGMDIESVNSYQEGRLALKRECHDICLVDYKLGVEDGLQFIQESIADGCRLPFIIITGQDNRKVDLVALEAGATDYLVKNELTPAILGRAIRYAIDRKHAEEQISLARDEAMELSRAKSEFLSNISHEMRTPMNGVIGMLDLLAGSELSKKQREHLMLARFSAKSMLEQLDRVIEYSCSEEPGINNRLIQFNVRDVVESAIDPIRYNAAFKGLKLSIRFASTLPDTLFGEAEALGKILHHLVDNAIKFTDKGEVQVTMDASPRADGVVELSGKVSDTGIGISDQQSGIIFRAFRQVDGSLTRHHGGTGLGLSIVKRLIRKLGGEVTVESQLGQGSTFTFTIPMLPDMREPASIGLVMQTEFSEQEEDVKPDDVPKLKVLLADDSKVTRLVFSSLLKRYGHEVVEVVNGSEAFVKYKSERFDLILMDVQMPVMNGLSTTKLIRADESQTGIHTPILALTAADTKADLERCIQTGMDGYLSKNITAEELLDVLQCYVKPDRQKETELTDCRDKDRGTSALKCMVSEKMGPATSIGEERDDGNEEGIPSLLDSLRQSVAYRDESLMEKCSVKMKRLALKMNHERLADETFRVQLAYRRGDLDAARQHLRSVEELVSRKIGQAGIELDLNSNLQDSTHRLIS